MSPSEFKAGLTNAADALFEGAQPFHDTLEISDDANAVAKACNALASSFASQFSGARLRAAILIDDPNLIPPCF